MKAKLLFRERVVYSDGGVAGGNLALGRDYKRVHQYVKAFKAVGLIEEENGTLRAGYDRIQTSILLGNAA